MVDATVVIVAFAAMILLATSYMVVMGIVVWVLFSAIRMAMVAPCSAAYHQPPQPAPMEETTHDRT